MKAISKLFIILLTIGLFSSCNSLNLTNQEAESLITKTLKLPQPASIDFQLREIQAKYYRELLDEGIIEYVNGWLEITEKGNSFLIEKGQNERGYPFLRLRTCELELKEITGIAINKEQQTATIRFVLKSINVTPIGLACVKDINNPINKELNFKKFDTGWQLESDQN